jgi:hypothetical protein
VTAGTERTSARLTFGQPLDTPVAASGARSATTVFPVETSWIRAAVAGSSIRLTVSW